MIYGFDTEKRHEAVSALLIYAVYRSRNKEQFKISLDMWDKIERFVKSSAKRAKTIPVFLEKFKKKIKCHSLKPKWMEVGLKNDIGLLSRQNKAGVTEYIELGGKVEREFMTKVINTADHALVIDSLKNETNWIILLLRERLEREKPQEKFIKQTEENEA